MGHRTKFDDDTRDEFRPRFGRPDRARERVASSPLRVATLVRRGHGRLGAGRTTSLPPTAGFGPRQNARRVVVKAHVHKLRGHGAQAAARHLRYIERDGVANDGSPGVLYGPEGRAVRETFEQPRLGERHQFRFIVSPEDARDLDLTDYVRELMKRVECDLGRHVEWAAVNHHDTDHPHAHVVVRGVCREGRPLRMDRAYIARGFQWSAQELATERLGPRLETEIQRTREREVHQERFTSLDRAIEQAASERCVDVASLVERRGGPEPALLVRRLHQLQALGLAEGVAPSGWVLAEDWQRRLRDLGERGDILKQMHRALHGGDPQRFHVVRPGQGLPDGRGGVEERPLVGRVVRKGLGDELHGRTFYAVIETPTGDAYHVTVAAHLADALRVGDLVSLGTKREPAVQPVDRHLAEVAAARRGVYELAADADRQDLARQAARRLRALERVGIVTSAAPGQWTVPPDFLAQFEERHRRTLGRYRVALERLPLGLDAQIGHHGPVWLDTLDGARMADTGLGAEVLAALERRRHVLRELGIAPDDPQRGAKIAELEKRAVGKEIARIVGQELLESAPPGFRGRLRRGPAGSPYLAVSDGARFVLVPDAPEARSQTGRHVEVVRDAGGGPVLAQGRADHGELARQAAGETFARDTRMTFLKSVPEGFVGRVRAGAAGSGHLAISDGARFVLVPATPEALALAGRTVEVARDAQGRFVGLRPRSLDRER
jgi:type IV secretory pathway VirD2 relaxase